MYHGDRGCGHEDIVAVLTNGSPGNPSIWVIDVGCGGGSPPSVEMSHGKTPWRQSKGRYN